MPSKPVKATSRRERVREQRARSAQRWWSGHLRRAASWPVLVGTSFTILASVTSLVGDETLPYAIGQRVDQPVYAEVEFTVPDLMRTSENREAAAAQTPSHYRHVARPVAEAIRADFMRLYDLAASAETFDEYKLALADVGWPAEQPAYERLRELVDRPDEKGRAEFQKWVDTLPIETEYIVRELPNEPRDPKSTVDHIVLHSSGADGELVEQVPHNRLVRQGDRRALSGSAAELARKLPEYKLRSTAEAVILSSFSQQPTIVYDQLLTAEAMQKARDLTPQVAAFYEKGKPIVLPSSDREDPGLQAAEYALLQRHRQEYLRFLDTDTPEAAAERKARLLQRIGMVGLITLLSTALFAYVGMNQPRAFELPSRILTFVVLILGLLLVSRLIDMKWPLVPEAVLTPALIAGSAVGIVYPRRFAFGVVCMVAVLLALILRGELAFLIALLTGMVVMVYQLDDVRTRTKIIRAGFATALAVAIASASGNLLTRQSLDFVAWHATAAAACALLAAFVVSGVLPFIERIFNTATSLTLLEWTDSRIPLLQLLAREAPGTYNHSLNLGALSRSACEAIGANGLLAQVGALYHDIGKIHKAYYFTENQEGQINRHEKLSPTMSLLIILAHVKDGLEMAREYRLPRVLHQFIAEHHGTTVVKYFHHMATEKQPGIASGKHDREVPEAEFRYPGPKPRTKESAVLMLADGVEGAVRSLNEPTAGRIESMVHQIVMARLDDGQLNDCDITLREIRLVEESLVKSLCSIYHGRVAYPKSTKGQPAPASEPGEAALRETELRPAVG